MDPVSLSLPEIIINDRGDFDTTPPNLSSTNHQTSPGSGSGLSDKPRKPKRSKSTPQKNQKIIDLFGQFNQPDFSSTLNESTSSRSSPSGSFNQQNQLLIQAHSGSSPFQLQTLSPCFGSPTGIWTPSPPNPSCWLNMSPITSPPNPRFGCSPYVLVPVNQCMAPCPPLVLPHANPSWCSCPPMVYDFPPYTPDLASGGPVQPVSELPEFAETRERSEETGMPEGGTQTHEEPHGSQTLLDDEALAVLAFEDYNTVIDSLLSENGNENLGIADDSFEEFLDKLWRDEELVREFGLTLNMEPPASLQPLDPQLDHVAPDNQTQEELTYPPSVNTNYEHVTEGKYQVESTMNTEHLDSAVSSAPEPIDFLPLIELQQEPLEEILEQLLTLTSGDSNVISPETKETSQLASNNEAPLQRAQSPILGPPSSQFDSNPNHNGQTTLQEELLPPNATVKYLEMTHLCRRCGTLFMDDNVTSYLQFPPNVTPDTSLIPELQEKSSNAPAPDSPSRDLSEATSAFLLHLEDTELDWTTQKLQEGPPVGDPSTFFEFPSTSRVSEPNGDLHTIANKDPMPNSGADVSNTEPSQSASPQTLIVQALKALDQTPSPFKTPLEQCSPKTLNPNLSSLESVLVQANLSSVADSNAEPRDPKVGANSSDSKPGNQTLVTPKDLKVSQEFASSGMALSAGKSSTFWINCNEKGLGTPVARMQPVLKARKEKRLKEGKGGNKERTNIRRSQRLLDLIGKGEAGMGGQIRQSITPTPKFSPEKDGEQKTESFMKRQRDLGEFEEQNMATKTARTTKQLTEMNKKVHRQNITEEIKQVKTEQRLQCKDNYPQFIQLEIEKSKVKSSPMREMPDDQKQEDATEPKTLIVKSQIKRNKGKRDRKDSQKKDENAKSNNKNKVSKNCSPVCPLRCPRVKKNTQSEEPLEDEQSNKTNDPTSVKTCMESPNLTSVVCLGTWQQSNERMKGGGGTRRMTYEFSPIKRCQQELGASKEIETKTDKIRFSPMKRGRWKSRFEGNFESGKEGPGETPACKPNHTSTKCNINTCDKKISPVSEAESPLRCPRVQTNTASEEPLEDKPSDKTNDPISVKPGKKPPNITPVVRLGTWQQSKPVASSQSEVAGTKTHDFYSLRSGTCKTRENKAPEVVHGQNICDPTSDQTAGLKGGDERMKGGGGTRRMTYEFSPIKRCQQELGASEKTETKTDKIRLSSIKRGRQKSRFKGNFESGKEGSGETSACKPNPSSTKCDINTYDQKISPVSEAESPLRCPRVQTNTASEEPLADKPSDKTNDPISVKPGKKPPNITPVVCLGTWQQSKPVASSQSEGAGTKTPDFYSLRSGTCKTRENKAPEVVHGQNICDPTSDQTAGLKGGDERMKGGGGTRRMTYEFSPIKRCQKELGASEKTETKTDKIRLSSIKRGRQKRRFKGNFESGKEGSGETSACKPNPSSTKCDINTYDQKISPVSEAESPLRCPRVQTNTASEEPLEDKPSDKTNDPISVKPGKKPPNITPVVRLGTWQQSKPVASSQSEGAGTKTPDFYSLRSGTTKTQENKAPEVVHGQNICDPTSDQTAGLKGGDERMKGGGGTRRMTYEFSPIKRCQQELGASEETETKTDTIRLSPMKRGRWKSRTEGSGDTSACKPKPTSTKCNINTCDKKIGCYSPEETVKDEKCCGMKTRSSCEGNSNPRFPSMQQQGLSDKLPSKYKDFVSFKTKARKHQPNKKSGKGGITLRSGRKIDNYREQKQREQKERSEEHNERHFEHANVLNTANCL
ncbi:uncharacterized protein LOC117807104 isoform X2 [Notolabrus celidotus]|uniref:uncharacterized protein LOC117807104 isoform X2 n=1 Tax=Notolabrus celidotus TaxID=1203425 RepID=UPI0014908532|nr:uncharacterized protein LOC117807104 isoform X2 [Notolabrus celidotus]